jgi:hypothetical protein
MEVRLGLATPHLVMGEGQACLVSGWVRVTWRREGLARRFQHALTLSTRACLRSSLTSAGCADSPSARLSNLPPRREPTSDVSCPLALSGLLQHCLARLNARCREADHAHLVSAADQCRRRGAAARRGRDARLYRFLRLPAESNRAWTASCRQLTPSCRRTGRFPQPARRWGCSLSASCSLACQAQRQPRCCCSGSRPLRCIHCWYQRPPSGPQRQSRTA